MCIRDRDTPLCTCISFSSGSNFMAQSAYCSLLNETLPCLKIRKLWWWMRSKQNFVWGLSVLSVNWSKVIQWPVIIYYASYHKNLTPISNFALSNQLNFYLLISQNQYRFFILQITHFLFRKLEMFISQNTDFHFISFGKL